MGYIFPPLSQAVNCASMRHFIEEGACLNARNHPQAGRPAHNPLISHFPQLLRWLMACRLLHMVATHGVMSDMSKCQGVQRRPSFSNWYYRRRVPLDLVHDTSSFQLFSAFSCYPALTSDYPPHGGHRPARLHMVGRLHLFAKSLYALGVPARQRALTSDAPTGSQGYRVVNLTSRLLPRPIGAEK